MNLISAKALSELHLNGVSIDWVKEDKTVKELRLHDGNGGRIIVRACSYGDTSMSHGGSSCGPVNWDKHRAALQAQGDER